MQRNRTSFENLADFAAYQDYIYGAINREKMCFLERHVAAVINERLTAKQRQYIIPYSQGKRIIEIAEDFGVSHSTVSRTIKRAKEKIEVYLKPIVEWNDIFKCY